MIEQRPGAREGGGRPRQRVPANGGTEGIGHLPFRPERLRWRVALRELVQPEVVDRFGFRPELAVAREVLEPHRAIGVGVLDVAGFQGELAAVVDERVVALDEREGVPLEIRVTGPQRQLVVARGPIEEPGLELREVRVDRPAREALQGVGERVAPPGRPEVVDVRRQRPRWRHRRGVRRGLPPCLRYAAYGEHTAQRNCPRAIHGWLHLAQ